MKKQKICIFGICLLDFNDVAVVVLPDPKALKGPLFIALQLIATQVLLPSPDWAVAPVLHVTSVNCHSAIAAIS